MRIFLPNSANLQNITALFPHIDTSDETTLQFSMHPNWVAVHPVVLAMTACLAERVKLNSGTICGVVSPVPSLPYLVRMGLFRFLGIDPGITIKEHEESGRFVPLTQIRDTNELKETIANIVPLLHAPAAVADPIRYVFSEMVRNSLEHARSTTGAFVCAQYYKESQRIAIGIADGGIGVYEAMRRNHPIRTHKDALSLALQPGISGTTSKIGGTEFNAGAGLFFTKSIAELSRNRFLIYSGDSMYRLMKTKEKYDVTLNADPIRDPHKFEVAPHWQGTIVGIDLNIERDLGFSALLDFIRNAYFINVKKKKDYANRIKFK